jgi:predicted TIM-barrel fold metal-dependent hydrolase
VFDHIGQLPQQQGVDHPAFKVYQRWLGLGKTWFKLSGAYLTNKKADYSDIDVVVKVMIATAPDRLIWGSDWPHPTKKANEKPNDAAMLNLLQNWAPQVDVREKILVSNPAKLYGY